MTSIQQNYEGFEEHRDEVIERTTVRGINLKRRASKSRVRGECQYGELTSMRDLSLMHISDDILLEIWDILTR
ncbi:hypothetical protein JA1_001072 [Spathaspora sp. JA1]|nr:hypothetical protein JA1_001072 [Spathaspora sp. JA1]